MVAFAGLGMRIPRKRNQNKKMVAFSGLRMCIPRKRNPDYFGGADPDSTSTGGNTPPVRTRNYTVPQQENAETLALANFAFNKCKLKVGPWVCTNLKIP